MGGRVGGGFTETNGGLFLTRGPLDYCWGRLLLRCLLAWLAFRHSGLGCHHVLVTFPGQTISIKPTSMVLTLIFIFFLHIVALKLPLICGLNCLMPNFPRDYRQKLRLLFVIESPSLARRHLINSWMKK